MKKYKVIVEGNNFLIRFEDKIKKYGFFTVRFVEAQNEAEAETKVIEMLRNDANLVALVRNEETDPPMMYAEEIEEVKSFGKFSVPGTGFAWYPDDSCGH